MKHLESFAKPAVIAVLICAFLYVYYRGSNIFSLMNPPPRASLPGQEREAVEGTERAGGAPNIPSAVPLAFAGPTVQDQNPALPGNPLPGPPTNREVVSPAGPDQNTPLPQPRAAADKALIEGHWIGGEVIPLTPAVAKANSIPPDVVGVLFDEVTLLSAEAGLLAGDVVTAINGKKVTDLKSFHLATKEVAQSNRALVSVYRGGKNKDLLISSTEMLGIAQMEGAPMILATDRSPHAYYGPCDQCHVIATNTARTITNLNSKNALTPNELLKDAGDNLTKVAPNIRRGTPPPHRNRGTCTLCHVVL
ncbi:MAG: PDZ domain-containing protein [Deltaproteobacteria bacterium]|nr:PDZ domain-containing protein [Deltaproteobacteria bacterium]